PLGAEARRVDRTTVAQTALQELRPQVPAREARANSALELGGRVLEGTREPEHPLAVRLAAEATVRALEAEPRERAVSLAECPPALAGVAELGQPGLERVGQVERRGVAVLRTARHRFQADRLKRWIERAPASPRGWKDPPAHAVEHGHEVAVGERLA